MKPTNPLPPFQYCIWCAEKLSPESKVSDDGWRCAHCQRLTGFRDVGETPQICPSCKTAFLDAAHYCPACGTGSSSCPPSKLQSEYGLLPSPMQAMWPMKSWREEDGIGLIAPPCPACGEKLRPDSAGSHHHPGYAFPPWNAGWDGRCAACGGEVGAIIEQQTHRTTKRFVSMRPEQSFHQTFIDEGMVFCGVRIRVEETQYDDEEPKVAEVFLSMGELTNLVRSLEGKAKPLLSQLDWSCDWT